MSRRPLRALFLAPLVAAVLLASSLLASSPSLAHAGDVRAGEPAMEALLVTSHPWSWPLAPPRPVTRPFDLRSPYAAGHRGIDLAAAPGVTITSPAPGVVHFAGVVVDRPVLSIQHDDGSISSFEPVDALVEVGARVERGHAVATLSPSVRHTPDGGLHLGARIDGSYVDPLTLLEVPPASVLLPIGGAPPVALSTAAMIASPRKDLS